MPTPTTQTILKALAPEMTVLVGSHRDPTYTTRREAFLRVVEWAFREGSTSAIELIEEGLVRNVLPAVEALTVTYCADDPDEKRPLIDRDALVVLLFTGVPGS
jgi:hypothetical protein